MVRKDTKRGFCMRVNVEKVYELHDQGATNKKIAEKLGISPGSVKYWLDKKGLVANGKSLPLNIINELEAKCSRCNKIKPITEFQTNRRSQKYEYKFSYCNTCRYKQITRNLNSNNKKTFKELLRHAKRRSKKENIYYDLDVNYILELYKKQNKKCFYTESDMEIGYGKGSHSYQLSVDKIIPEKGYVKGNVVLCTRRANTAKGDLTLDEIQKWMPLWYEKIMEFLA